MRLPKADHCKLGKGEAGTETMFCEHCGEMVRYFLPLPVAMWVAMMKAFIKIHRHCKAKEEVMPDNLSN